MNHDENAHNVAPGGDGLVNGKTEFSHGQDEISDEFILEADLSGRTRIVSSDFAEAEAEKEKDERKVDMVQTVTQLEELNRLLGELNFRELILQFGKVQGDLELIRYELDLVKKEGLQVQESLSQSDYLENHDKVNPMELIGELRERIYALADCVRQLISQQEILSSYANSSRGWLLERSGEVLHALGRVREAQKSRMEMVASLTRMLDSDAPNEKLASAALEFAVLMRELDGEEGLKQLDSVIVEMGGFRDEVEQAETMVLGDPIRLDTLKDNLGLLEEVPNMAGELLSFLTMVVRTLDKIASGWNGTQSTENTNQEEMPLTESDE
ncbi:MAG: hypothetical protein CO090_08035 [Acidobacteria bacterium CG_4_9_14_3_um_filter_49_7]|nr:MAG: hypothetical protein CO090_08035 [Acidobacteria bacterium CG_4_9_14_3_um_filter_49_7]